MNTDLDKLQKKLLKSLGMTKKEMEKFRDGFSQGFEAARTTDEYKLGKLLLEFLDSRYQSHPEDY